jgi:hypothetical protein
MVGGYELIGIESPQLVRRCVFWHAMVSIFRFVPMFSHNSHPLSPFLLVPTLFPLARSLGPSLHSLPPFQVRPRSAFLVRQGSIASLLVSFQL